MSNLIARAASILRGNADRESTGTRKHHTPLLDRMGAVAKAGAVGSMVLLSACTTTGQGMNKQSAGTLLGAVVGGLAGSEIGGGTGKLVAVGVGTLLGAAIGSEVGASLDRADLDQMQRAEQRAQTARLGERIQWQNPRSGNSGYVTPTREGRTQSGAYCREYQTTIMVGGRLEEAYGTACRQPNGAWKVMSSADTPRDTDFAEVTATAPAVHLAAAGGPGPRLG